MGFQHVSATFFLDDEMISGYFHGGKHQAEGSRTIGFPSHCPTARTDYCKQTRWTGLVPKSSWRCDYGSMCVVHYPEVIYTGSLADLLRAEERWELFWMMKSLGYSWRCCIFNTKLRRTAHMSIEEKGNVFIYHISMYAYRCTILCNYTHMCVCVCVCAMVKTWYGDPAHGITNDHTHFPGFPGGVPARFVPDLWGGGASRAVVHGMVTNS